MDDNARNWDDGATTIEEASKLYPRECVWLIEHFASSGLDNLITDLMTAKLTSVNQDTMIILDKVQGSQWLQNVHNQGRGNLSTVEAMVRGLANGITAAMRNYPQEGEELSDAVREEPYDYETEEEAKIRRTMRLERDKLGSYRGLAYQVDTCIIVHWAWIAYPGFLLLLQVVFCAAMLLTKPTSGAAARDAGEFSDWKSSPLVLVSLGWGESLHRKLRPLYSVKDADDIVGKTKVMLQRGDPDDPRAARWQLVDC